MGRPRLKHSEILERRDRVYTLFLIGMSQTEIAAQVGISQQAVSEHLAAGVKSKIPKSRRQAYYALGQEIADSARLAKNHAYKILADAVKKNNPSAQLGALSRIQASDALLSNLMPTLESLSWWEQLDELRQAAAEQRLAQKVLPSGRLVPADSELVEK
jgi:predicted transcriptional regulator